MFCQRQRWSDTDCTSGMTICLSAIAFGDDGRCLVLYQPKWLVEFLSSPGFWHHSCSITQCSFFNNLAQPVRIVMLWFVNTTKGSWKHPPWHLRFRRCISPCLGSSSPLRGNSERFFYAQGFRFVSELMILHQLISLFHFGTKHMIYDCAPKV